MSSSPHWRDLLIEHWQLARTLRRLEIVFAPQRCIGLFECYEVCPVDCWKLDDQSQRVEFIGRSHCIACNACVLQCSADAIELKVV